MTDYEKLKVADLKELIKDRGIASTGLKLKQHFIELSQQTNNSSFTYKELLFFSFIIAKNLLYHKLGITSN